MLQEFSAISAIPSASLREIPVFAIRVTVDEAHRGQKLGSALLWDAGMRALRSEIAVYALMVDAKDESAEAFFRHHGLIAFGNPPRQLVLPLATFAKG